MLLAMDRGFFAKHRKVLRTRMLHWVELAGADNFPKSPLTYPDDSVVLKDDERYRCIHYDAMRTFNHEAHRKLLERFLFAVQQDLGEYSGIAFMASLLRLGLTDEESLAVLRKIDHDYIPGHWQREAVGFATSAYVIEEFIRRRFPDVAAHLDSLHLQPVTYMQKIISGLTIHVLPFDMMFSFLDTFMAEGFAFLVKFELAIFEHFRSEILSINDDSRISELFDILRLDTKVVEHADMKRILDRAQRMSRRGLDGESIAALRSKVYKEKVAPLLQRAKPSGLEEDDVMTE